MHNSLTTFYTYQLDSDTVYDFQNLHQKFFEKTR